MSQTPVREVPIFESLLRHHPDRGFFHRLSQFCQGDSWIVFRDAAAVFSRILSSWSCTSHPASFYRGVDKSLARPTSRCILFDGENISFVASLVMYINSTNIPQIMIINSIYETQNFLSL